MRRHILVSLGLLFGLPLLGCGGDAPQMPSFGAVKEAVNKGVEQVKSKVEETKEQVASKIEAKVEEQAAAAVVPGIELELGGPVKIDKCFAELVQGSSDYPTVLQISSSEVERQDRFPAVFVQAQVAAGSMAELVGKTIPAQVFVQLSGGDPVWFTDDEHPAELVVESAGVASLEGRLSSSGLLSTADGSSLELQGRFAALVH